MRVTSFDDDFNHVISDMGLARTSQRMTTSSSSEREEGGLTIDRVGVTENRDNSMLKLFTVSCDHCTYLVDIYAHTSQVSVVHVSLVQAYQAHPAEQKLR